MEEEDLSQITQNTSNTVKGYWSNEEREKFIEAIFLFGKDWKKVCVYIKTRTIEQSRSHSQKYFSNLKKVFLTENTSTEENNQFIKKWIRNYVRENIMPFVIKFHNGVENFNKKLQNMCMLILKALTKPKENNNKKNNIIKCCCRPKKACDCGDGCCKTSTSEEDIYFDFENISQDNLIKNNSLTGHHCKNKNKVKEEDIFKIHEISTNSENISNSKNILFSLNQNVELEPEPEVLFHEIKLPSLFENPASIPEVDIQEYNLNLNSPSPFDEVLSCKFNIDTVFDFNIDEYFHFSNNFTS